MFVLFFTQGIAHAQKITDTIFYNRTWQICEKPIAHYYRIGTLAVDSSVWFYTGEFRDFALNGQLVAEGEYNDKGQRNGLFRFYYPDGKLMVSGKFWQSFMIGDWQWYYSNDSLKAIVNFDGVAGDFKFIKYKFPDGKITLDNGVGDFEWYTDLYNTRLPGFKVYGSFAAGKRSGSWRYYTVKNGAESFQFAEKYDKDGKFKKASLSADYKGKPTDRYAGYIFIPPTLWITENIFYDNFFNRGDSAGYVAVLNYLLNRKSSEIIVKNKKVENALLQIIHSLEHNRGRLEYQQKEIDGKIEFKIGEKGYPEDLTVTGNGITEKEKEFIIFLVSKFSQLEMQSIESVAIETYYTINLYSINMKEFVPAAVRDQVNNELFFTTLPKENFLILLKSIKKKMKKYIREEIQFYW